MCLNRFVIFCFVRLHIPKLCQEDRGGGGYSDDDLRNNFSFLNTVLP